MPSQAFVQIDANLATSSQPTVDELNALSARGVKHVINLALPSSDHAVSNESALVAAQGINYVQIPVQWENPTVEQFTLFSQILWAMREESVLVHCAMNMRASTFVFLYRVLYEGAPIREAVADLIAVWEPTGVWLEFVESVLSSKGLSMSEAASA